MILSVKTRERTELVDITSEINQLVKKSGIDQGLCMVYVPHTTAGVTINENADPSVRDDFESFMAKLIPENDSCFTHIFEGADDMPAHIKSSLLGSSVTIPVKNGRFNLGTWQGIYLCEHRNNGGSRKVVVTVFGK